MSDLISIIVPIYRVEKYLDECIQSIINQTYHNLEIILVDDGSDDGSGEICDKYAKIDTRIKVIHQDNAGQDAARRAGLLLSQGVYIGYVDADDWIELEMYERLIGFAKKYEVDVVESSVIDSWKAHQRKRYPNFPEGCYIGEQFKREIEPKVLYTGRFFQHGIMPYLVSKLFKREVIESIQLKTNEINKFFDDVLLSIPAVVTSKSLYITHECYYHYRVCGVSSKRSFTPEQLSKGLECFSRFYPRLEGSLLCEKKDRQLEYYKLYWLLLKAPYVFDNLDKNEILTPFGGLDKNTNIVLYGAGVMGIHLERYLKSLGCINVVAWVDKNFDTLNDSLDVCAPDILKDCEYDYVLITVLREETVKSIRKDLEKLGIPENKILWIQERYLQNPSLLLDKIANHLEEKWAKE